MADKMSLYNDVRDLVEEEIEKITKKDTLDEKCLEYLYKLMDISKDVETVTAMQAEYDSGMNGGYSNRMYPHYMNEGMRGGNSYRGNGGRYSNMDGGSYYGGSRGNGMGYSRTGGDIMTRLETMMAEAPTEREREAIRRALEQM